MSERVSAVLAGDEHAEAVAAFYRESWDPESTPEAVLAARRAEAAANVAYPGEMPPTAIVLQGSRVIGYCGSIAQRLWDGTRERPAYWVKGLQVLPEFRGGPVGFFVMKELAKYLELSTILTVAPAARRLFGAVGYTDLGAIPNWVRPLRPGRMLARLNLDALGVAVLPTWAAAMVRLAQRSGAATVLGGAGGVALRGGAAAMRLAAAGISTESSSASPTGADLRQLWERARPGLHASPVRDDRYLLPRFGGSANAGTYEFVTARRGGALVGVAVLRRPGTTTDPRLSGMRVATVSDVVFPAKETAIGLALLGELERAAMRADADALLCTAASPELTALLKRQAYLRASANVHFFLRDRSAATTWPTTLASWWLARGDGYSDEVF